ncbi:hypothetical protein CSH63_29305 [Micromonospora tulbaghiae]|uniref:Uncharacterized protein n=1 Tax=Micromonospora tulbaghiae TaxID=479978 RepID=A0A386WTW8_9ACTN|nr:hypothetical protein [Micromonospora tulbaghiae]AYF31472.1 hypothetical protein CSH63_29305 [Micromonospora tulbaghiae]
MSSNLSAAYAANTPPPNRAEQARAAAWQPDPDHEAALRLRTENPDAYHRLPSTKRMAVGMYEADKAAAAAAGRNTAA